MSNCSLRGETIAYLALGLSANTSLTKLILSDNICIGKDGISKLCDALIDNKKECKLIDLDLAKCNINSDCAQPIIRLMNSNYKLRHLNLKDNVIKDDVATEMLGALLNFNSYVTRCNLEFNPIRHHTMKEIEAITKANILKVNEQEIPQMKQEINEYRISTAMQLLESYNDPLVRDYIEELIPASHLDSLKRLN